MAATKRHPGARNAKPSSPGRAAVPTDAVFTVDDLAAYLKLPKRTIYKLAQEGKIPGQKVGRHWRFHHEVIDAWLKRGPCVRTARMEPTATIRTRAGVTQ